MSDDAIQDTIRRQVADNPIILYMKGSPDQPMCGFSQRAAQALAGCGQEFAYMDVLQDDRIREGIKVFGDWPTIPQLYINGELVGGCDIIMEMFESGELQQLVDSAAAQAGP